MAIYTNFSELIEDVKKYLDRDEESIIKRIPLWVNMVEDNLDRILRHPASEILVKYSAKSGYTTIPAPNNLTEIKMLRIVDNKRVLYRRSLETLYDLPDVDNYPMGFALRANQFVLDKPLFKDMEIEYLYYAVPDKLKANSDSNFYLKSCGDLLLYGTLAEAFAYDTNYEESNYWKSKASDALTMLQEQIDKEEFAGSTLINFGDLDFIEQYY